MGRDREAIIRSKHPVPEIYERPGFQIRQAHQNSVSAFLDCLKPFDLTPSQYGALVAVVRWGPISQIDLARSLGFDRTTTALVVGLLVKRKLLQRSRDNSDKRKFALTATDAGKKLLAASAAAAEQAKLRLLAPFSKREAADFLRLLRKFNDSFGGLSAAPRRKQS